MPESNNKRKNGKVPVKQVAKKASKRDTFIAEAKDIRAACLGLIGNSAQIKELIFDAQILLEKGLYNHISKRLKRARELAEKYERNTEALEINQQR